MSNENDSQYKYIIGAVHKKKKMSKRKKVLLILLFTLIGLILILAISAIVMINMGKGSVLNDNTTGLDIEVPDFAEIDGDVITYNGKKYRYNQNMASILFMGVDKEELEQSEKIGKAGQADALFLYAIDTQSGKSTVFNISRDTMTDVNAYKSDGSYDRTINQQICLGYAYGDGKEISCQYEAVAVSRLFYGVPINTYLSIDLNTISVLNDAVDGITVTVLDDLTKSDPELEKGKTVTLWGEQAEIYVRNRDMVAVDANEYRRERQQQYVDAYIKRALQKTKEDFSFPINTYNLIENQIATNVDATKVSYLAYLMLTNGFGESELKKVPGEVKMGEVYAEFHVDYEEFYEMILETYYTRVA